MRVGRRGWLGPRHIGQLGLRMARHRMGRQLSLGQQRRRRSMQLRTEKNRLFIQTVIGFLNLSTHFHFDLGFCLVFKLTVEMFELV
jgi:hypothetical protein